MLLLQQFIRIIGGDQSTLEQRSLCVVLFIATLCCLSYTIFYWFSLKGWQALSPASAIIIFGGFYYVARFKNYYDQLIIPITLMVCLMLSIAWFFMNGPLGAVGSFYFVFIVAFLLTIKTKYHYLVTAFIFVNLICLYLVEYFYPNWVQPYPNTQVEYLDTLITLVFSMIFAVVLIHFFKVSYEGEKEKVKERNVQLEQMLDKLKDKEDSLQQALEKQKEILALKSHFVSVVSHQFRTPLTIIQSNLELCEMRLERVEMELPNWMDTINQRIQYEVGRLNYLLDDVLVLSKLEANKTPFEPKINDIVALCEQVIYQDFEAIAFIELKIFGKKQLVCYDQKLLSHALSNLISNAIKYSKTTKKPQVHLVFKDKQVQLKVIDFGIGIDDSDLPNLFQTFYRGKNVQHIEGTGLGLVIAKEFVEIHGGSIDVSSVKNQETIFTINLPIQAEHLHEDCMKK